MSRAEVEISTHIGGDWTISKITDRVHSLMDFSSQQMDTVLKGLVVNVDCSGVENIDISGLQLLYVWLHCMKMKGFRAQFINMSTVMRELVQKMEVHAIFAAPQVAAI